jgi:signal transduction histidine kinase/ligand-binding sensor domain-containing protein
MNAPAFGLSMGVRSATLRPPAGDREMDSRLPRFLRRGLLLRSLGTSITALLLCAPAHALSPDLKVSQFYHTAWTVKEGAPTNVYALVQTVEGYLWIGGSAGLFRFDGVHFERIDAIRQHPLPSTYVHALWAPPSGGLWVGYSFGGASFIKDGRIENFGEREGLPVGTVRGFAQDKSGAVWIATTRGIRRLDGSRWVDVGPELGLPKSYVSLVTFDSTGTLWLAVDNSIMYRPAGQRTLATTDIQLGGEIKFLQGPDGTLWLVDDEKGVRALYSPTGTTNSGNGWIRPRDPRSGWMNVSFIDREGTFWMSTPTGIRRLRDPIGVLREGSTDLDPADGFSPKDGLTGLASTNSLSSLEDREGNVWFGTTGGLDRFRESRLTRVDLANESSDFALAAGDDGAMLVGEYSQHGAVKITKGHTIEAIPGPRDITCAYRDSDGILWFGGREGIWRSTGQRIEAISLPLDNHVKQTYSGIQAIAKDRSGTLWVSIVRAGVFRLTDGKWVRYGAPGETAVSLTADRDGRVWIGYPNNRVQIVDKDSVRRLSSENGLEIGAVLSISVVDRNAWVGGEHGLARFDGRRFNAVTREGGRALPTVSGIVETADGDLWLSTSEGALKVPADEVRKVVGNPPYPVHYSLLDYLDGMPGTPQSVRPLPTMVQGTDGRLWFATSNGIAWTEPKHMVRNMLAPTVDVQSIIADTIRYDPLMGLVLPIRTRNLQINYAALSLSIPERVRYRYQLGSQQPWQDVGARREAYFTDLAPGHYRFRVIASNNDGVWNETGASVDFTIPPAFVQTKWFLAIVIAAGGTLLWSLLLLRVRQVRERMRGRLEERLLERERIAQDLHDTLLQGLLSASLQLSVAKDQIAPDTAAKPLLDRIFHQLRQMVDDSRNTVRGLRTQQVDPADLERAFSQIPQDLAAAEKIEYRLIMEGTPRSLRPVIRDQVYRIGREAIANAFRHSRGSVIEAVLDYGRDRLHIVVRDNGCGMDPQILRSGREGHWGLSGMRQRAATISATLKVLSGVGAGTEVDLIVPGSVAFVPSRPKRSRNWLTWFYARGDEE